MNSWTLNPETERIRKERNAEAHAGNRQSGARKHRLLGHNGSGSGDARAASPLATQDGIGGTPSPVSKDADVGGADRRGEGQSSSPVRSDAADVSAQAEHAYHQWQEHFWGARERTFNRLGIRER